jgi:hypothetical protein
MVHFHWGLQVASNSNQFAAICFVDGSKFDLVWDRVRETFELIQLKSAPSQLLPVFFKDLIGCELVAIYLDRRISYYFFQVMANFFFIVMTTGQEFGH